MRLKSFFGPTLNEAMRLVRDALGEDAIIVTTYDEEGGGVRVTAAIEEQSQEHEAPSRPPKFDEPNGSTIIETIADAIVRHQVSAALAERLLAAATRYADDDPVVALAAALDTHFKFQPITDDTVNQPIIFVGPPGAGKTMATAKFAAAAAMAKRDVAVFSADTERAGGMEQLAAFTRLLKVDLMQIEDAPALRDAIRIQKADTLILVDTPGRNPFRKDELEQLRALVGVGGEAVLVMPSGMDSNEAIDMAHAFRTIGATRLIPTRLDFTRRLGSLLRTAYEARMPFANFSASPKVTEAPQPLNPVVLARMVLEGERT
jgi:flagellar biosynthesis protein FlhF